MKTILAVLAVLAICTVFAPAAHATDFVFSSFQCDPLACEETGPTATFSSAFMTVDAACTGGAVDGFHVSASASVINCQVPYTPYVKAEQLHATLLDDCGDPYNVDTLRVWAEVFSVFGNVVYSTHKDDGCDGGESAPIVFGEKPC